MSSFGPQNVYLVIFDLFGAFYEHFDFVGIGKLSLVGEGSSVSGLLICIKIKCNIVEELDCKKLKLISLHGLSPFPFHLLFLVLPFTTVAALGRLFPSFLWSNFISFLPLQKCLSHIRIISHHC